MPVKWNTVKVGEHLDAVEAAIAQAELFLAQACAEARAAQKIAGVPQYMGDRLDWLAIRATESAQRLRSALDSARKAIPEKDLRAQQQRVPLFN